MRRLAVAALFGLVVLGCSSSSKSSGTSSAAVTATDSRQFSPGTVTVSVGGKVTWTNGGQLAHTVTFDNGPAFDSALSTGGVVTRSFPAAGTFNYHCNIHGPSMHGTVIVK